MSVQVGPMWGYLGITADTSEHRTLNIVVIPEMQPTPLAISGNALEKLGRVVLAVFGRYISLECCRGQSYKVYRLEANSSPFHKEDHKCLKSALEEDEMIFNNRTIEQVSSPLSQSQ